MNLRFSTSILKRLGEELNVTPDRGILELVKNAYDADAEECVVELHEVTQPGGTIRVRDTGDGMREEQIKNSWLVLGASEKKTSTPTAKGRTPAGNKGLGRLAALRMGHAATLTTRPRSRGIEYEVDLPWDTFDAADLVEQVPIDIQQQPTNDPNGTVIEIRRLRERMGRNDAKRLARGLILLSDPFGGTDGGFTVRLVAPEFQDLESRVEVGYLDEAEFHLVARVDEHGVASAAVRDYRGNVLFEAGHADIRRGTDAVYDVPPIRFDFWVFVLDNDTFVTHSVGVGEVKDWLRSFGGVYLYTGDIRVASYGESGDDWLGINLARAARPYLRPSTRTSIGRVRIEAPDERLRQKTDRDGLVENDTFQSLRGFAQDSMEWLARERLREREAQRAQEQAETKQTVKDEATTVEAAIEDLPEKNRALLSAVFEEYKQANAKERAALEREIQLYRTLSTMGIVAATFAHESRHPIKLILRSANTVQLRAEELLGNQYDRFLRKPVDRILRQGSVLSSYGGVALSLAQKNRRRTQRVELHRLIAELADTLAPLLSERTTSLDLDLYSGDPYLRASPAAFESVVTNLIVNSLRALEGRQKRRILVRTQPTDGADLNLQIEVLDNGPGIRDISLKDIWLPGETTADDGTGYGLTIVRDIVREHGGRVQAVAQGELGGAAFTVNLPVLSL